QVDGGTLNGDASWNNPEVVYWRDGDNVVPAGKALTVGPGQVIKSVFGVLFVDGTLLAQGTAAQPIVFTDDTDDTQNDTNNDGAASSPTPGSWTRIEIRADSTQPESVMDHVEVRYGGLFSTGQVTVTNSRLDLSNSTISNSSSDGLRIVASNPKV